MSQHRLISMLLTVPLLSLVNFKQAEAQSSSLYVVTPAPVVQPAAASPPPEVTPGVSPGAVVTGTKPNPLSPAVAAVSYTAVKIPPPRKFAKHDLITIIVRESSEADVSASMETEKAAKIKGEITAMPRLQLTELLNLQLRNKTITDPPTIDAGIEREFEGDGSYKTAETVTARITARIIDVKPNGTLVLEARKSQQIDKETLELTVSGTCRTQDIRADNTVLSTQLYDLKLSKKHSGDIRRATRKGLLTRILETVFHF
jgi:flagellar L-ring protein precursor FlgH